MPVWNCCPQILQDRSPIPAFLSSFTDTDFSWLQKRHGKTVGRGSFCKAFISDRRTTFRLWHPTFFGPCGLRDDFLRLPYQQRLVLYKGSDHLLYLPTYHSDGFFERG